MYGVVLLAALCGAEEAACGDHKHCPPVLDGGGYPGYHNPAGWGRPYGGYGWTGYYCPSYQHVGPPAVTIPPEPLFVPPPPRRDDEQDDDEEETTPPKKNGTKPGYKKEGDKNGEEDDTAEVRSFDLGLGDLNAARKKTLGLADNTTGVAVTSAPVKGAANIAGMYEGMLIVSINGDPVSTAKQAADLLNKANVTAGIRLRVVDSKGERGWIILRR
jgi:hypothetical protein